LRGTMNPYRSTSPPLKSSQSSIPPASSFPSRTRLFSVLSILDPEVDGTESNDDPFAVIFGILFEWEGSLKLDFPICASELPLSP